MKKILKYTVISFCILITVLIITPLLFKDKIKDKVVSIINNNLEAEVNFKNIEFSLIKNFPQASISITNLSIVNKAPFYRDTLVYADIINAKMSIKEIFKLSNKPINIEGFSIKNALINIILNEDGKSNYDITIKNKDNSNNSENSDNKSNIALSIQKYELENTRITYLNKLQKTKLVLDKINHKGKGDFTNKSLDLDTQTSSVASLDIDGTNYVKSVNLLLDAVLNLDLENFKFSFKKNIAQINDMPLKFDGFVKLNDSGQLYDIKFSTPTSSFDNALRLIPSKYSGNIKNIKTSGEFSLNGWIKGIFSENKIPKFNIEILSNNSSIKYSELPKSIQNISIDAKIINNTGEIKDSYLDLNKLSFKIDNDIFNAKAKISNLTKNLLIKANIDGTVNLANLSEAYPINLEEKLSGIIKANTEINLDMNSIEQKKYENIHAKGSINLINFTYKTKELSKPLEISQMDLKFNPSYVHMSKLNAKIGDSDLQINGRLDNFYEFLFKKQVLKSKFDLKSNNLKISDLLTITKSESNVTEKNATEITEKAKIPAFLDCTINASAKKVIYDDLILEDVSGNLVIKEEKLKIQNLKTNIFEGNIIINGNVSTKSEKPIFDVDLDMRSLDISQSFSQLKMLGKIAPITNTITGKFSSKIKISGNLHDKELTPDLSSINGNLLGELHNAKVDKSKSKLLSGMDSNLDFVDLNKLNLDKLKADLSFENGKVNIRPMYIDYQDIKIKFSGSHSFDEIINYNAVFNVPAKYFGKDIEKLFANTDKNEIIPISTKITGNFSSPKIQTDINQVLNDLYKQFINKKGSDLLNDLIKNTKSDDNNTNNSNEIKDIAKEALNSIFGRKK